MREISSFLVIFHVLIQLNCDIIKWVNKMNNKHLSTGKKLLIMTLFSISLVFFGIPNLTKAPSKAMEPPAEGYDWKLKITKDSADIYKYVQDILSNKENRTNILSQDVGLKGYVTDIFLNFTAVQYRDTLSGQNRNPDAQELVKLMYPDNQFVENANELFNEELDYSKLPKLFQEFAKDYIIFSNKTALWDERGWYTSAYQSAIDSGLVSLVYQNDSWAILKMNPDWEPRKKSEDRYWVHMY